MKKASQFAVILAAITIIILVICGVSYSRWNIFEDGIKGIRSYRFELEMSIDEAKRHFSSYGKLTETIEKTEEKYEMEGIERKVTWLTYENMDEAFGNIEETLVLKFVNNKLYGFSYTNWKIE